MQHSRDLRTTPEEDPMTRFHVHLNVADLATSVTFYRGLFGA